MRIYKRKDSPHYWYSFTLNGARYRASTGTAVKSLANAFVSKTYEDEFLKRRFGKKGEMQLRYVFGKYYQEHACAQKWANSVTRYLTAMGEFWGLDTLLSQITNKELNEFIQHLKTRNIVNRGRAHEKMSEKRMKGATVNRYVSVFRKIYYLAKEVWGVRVGEINFKLHRQREADSRNRWATPDEVARLLEHSEPHMKNIILFALYTGVRCGNNLGLKWSQIDFPSRTISFMVKDKNREGGKALTVPMVEPCYQMLKRLAAQRHSEYVFTYNRQPIKSIQNAWKATCRRAGIKNLRIHDLRRTCGSWLEQSGTPLKLIKEIFGHADIKTTMGYVHHAAESKLEALQKLFLAQNWHADNPSYLKEVV